MNPDGAGKVAGVPGTPGAQAFDWRAASAMGSDGSGVGNQNVGSFNGVYNGNVRSLSISLSLGRDLWRLCAWCYQQLNRRAPYVCGRRG